jgi:hypothetical protein
MNVAILTVATLSLVVSTATLGVVLVGAKKVEQEVEEVRSKTNTTLQKIRFALHDLEV